MGGSVWAERHGVTGRALPEFNAWRERAEIALVVAAHARGLVRAAHDVSEGGVIQALAEMSFASGQKLGFAAHLATPVVARAKAKGRTAEAWFSEEPGFVLEVDPADADTLANWAVSLNVMLARLGQVEAAPRSPPSPSSGCRA